MISAAKRKDFGLKTASAQTTKDGRLVTWLMTKKIVIGIDLGTLGVTRCLSLPSKKEKTKWKLY